MSFVGGYAIGEMNALPKDVLSCWSQIWTSLNSVKSIWSGSAYICCPPVRVAANPGSPLHLSQIAEPRSDLGHGKFAGWESVKLCRRAGQLQQCPDSGHGQFNPREQKHVNTKK